MSAALVDHLFRHECGRILASLTRMLGVARLDLAEDVLQDALVMALRRWPYHGVPDNPGGWLMRVARNRALDTLRHETVRRRTDPTLATADTGSAVRETAVEVLDSEIRDDQLRMIFTCCHPALAPEARVALTLKTLCGFGVSEIARAFLVAEATVSRRLHRARQTLRRRAIPFEVPGAAELPARLDSVLDVLYLLFNEGYRASVGDELVRHELCAEAIRLISLLAEHPLADLPVVHALWSLMLLQAARLPARTDDAGALVLLEDQDRSLWDGRMIALGLAALERASAGPKLTTYHIEAAIAAAHAVAPSYAATDWPRILDQYDTLLRLTESPVAALNRAVAVAMVDGPAAGLGQLELVRTLPGMTAYHLLYATAGSFRTRLGDHKGAAADYQRAISLTDNQAERRFLARRLAESLALASPSHPAPACSQGDRIHQAVSWGGAG